MKTINYAFMLMLIGSIMAGCSNTSSSLKADKAGSYYTQLGVGYLQKGRMDLANLNLEKALEQDSGSAASPSLLCPASRTARG